MSLNLNHVILSGNLVRDPEARNVGESNVCTFTLANSRKYKDKAGETKEEAAFVDVECWGKTGELAAKYLTKGKSVIVEGGIRQQQWKDKDGNSRSKLLIRAELVHFIPESKGKGKDDSDGGSPSRSSAPAPGKPKDDEPPF